MSILGTPNVVADILRPSTIESITCVTFVAHAPEAARLIDTGGVGVATVLHALVNVDACWRFGLLVQWLEASFAHTLEAIGDGHTSGVATTIRTVAGFCAN